MAGEPPVKRYRRSPSPASAASEGEEEDYTPYIPVRERRKQQLVRLGRAGAELLTNSNGEHEVSSPAPIGSQP